MQSNEQIGITALYCRLSRDDKTDFKESNSISNQRKLLTQKAKEYGLSNTKVYIDDGITGTKFDRPGFQKMIDDIEAGYISTVMVKDLSRLGRDYILSGYYSDVYFPDRNVRFIAVNDCVDSADGENEIAPFKNVMNEMYARDISRKIKSSHRIRGNMGEPLAPPPYGYIKNPENKKQWIIEPEAAEIVRRIYRMCLDGMGNETIARILQEEKIENPMAYWHKRGQNRGGKHSQKNPYKWCKSTVAKILSQQEYCGDVINFKSHSKSFKNKTRVPNPKEEWKVFKDVHEPIIEREVFEQVQSKIVKKTKRRAPKPKNAEKNMFCDFLYCADCKSKLWYHTNTGNKDIHYFSFSNYKTDTRGDCETRHYIRADAVEQIVLLQLQKFITFIANDEEAFAQILADKTNKDIKREKKMCETVIQKATSRIATLSNLHQKLYEDNASGKVTDEWYMELSHKYENERADLKAKISELKQKQDELDKLQYGKESFISAVKRFMEMKVLTKQLLYQLIDRIEVYETEGVGKNRTQRVVIFWKFVGYIELPECVPQKNYKADTRQGVAVEYHTQALPA